MLQVSWGRCVCIRTTNPRFSLEFHAKTQQSHCREPYNPLYDAFKLTFQAKSRLASENYTKIFSLVFFYFIFPSLGKFSLDGRSFCCVFFLSLITHSRCGACRKVGRIAADFRQITVDAHLALVKPCVGDAMNASLSYDALIITSLTNKKFRTAEMKYFSLLRKQCG